MTEITLRAYIREIDKLIDQEKLDEAIAHCRHLLQRHPKYIECYRLLGKAYLEAKRYGDAADIFQRVLSAVPDDFVSHIGMSIVREDEGNLDSAIWHMERAFETNPANPAIQQELKRLIGRRDGFEPHKVRLTRGALARMYAHGELYPQAIAELQSALDENNDRPDLQVLLARLLWQTDKRTEAADVSGQLLDKLPFCMQATRITAAVLQERGKSEEATAYHRRLAQLDPYMAYTEAPMAEPVRVDADSIMVQKLDWQPGQPLPSTEAAPTDWAASLGLEDTGDEEETSTGPLPSWLDDVDSAPPTPTEAPETPRTQPFAEPPAAEAFEGEMPAESGQEQPAADDESIPNWMQDAGWQEATGDIEEQPVSFSSEELDQLERGELPAEEAVPSEESGELEPADIPSWLQGMAPSGNEEELAEDDEELEAILRGEGEPTGQALDLEEEFEADEAEIASTEEEEAKDFPAWLDEGEPGATSTIMTWLGDREQDEAPEEELPELADEPTLAAEEEAEEEVPTWLSGVAQAAAENEETEEEELAQFREQADRAQVEASELPEEAAESGDVPEWLRTITGEAEPAAEAMEPSEDEFLEEETELPWEAEVEAAEQETMPQEPGESSRVEDEEIPSWLGQLDEEKPAGPTAEETISPSDIDEEEEVEEDWLAGLDEPAQVEEELAEEASWLQELGAEDETGELELSGPSWMEGLAEEEEEPSEDEVEARASSWLDDLSDTLADTPSEPEPEALGWLDQVGELDDGPEASEPEMELEQPEEAEEDLGWLEDLESYDRGEGVQPEQPPPAAELDEIDEEGVFDWLDQMAAQQDQFAAGSDEIDEEPKTEGEPTVSEQAPPDTFDEGLDWLDRLSETRGIDADIEREPAAGTISGRMGREPAAEEPEPEAEGTEADRWEPEAAADATMAADQPEPSSGETEQPTDEEEIPSWLTGEAEPSAPEREAAPAEPEITPEWRQEESEPEPTSPPPGPPETEEVPTWLQEQEKAEGPQEAEEVPDWLQAQAESEPEKPAAAAPAAPAEAEAAPAPTPPEEEEVPDWLKSEEEAAEVEADSAQPPVAAELEAVQPESAEPSPEVEAEPEAEAEPLAPLPTEETIEPPVSQPPAAPDVEAVEPEVEEAAEAAVPAPPGPETVEEPKAEPETVPAQPPAEDDYSLGREALEEGDEAKAAQHFQNLIKERDRLEEVVAALEEHLGKDPDAPLLWQILGDAFMKLERTDQAVRAYDRGMEESEVFDSARQALAGADYERAAAQYGMLIKKKKRLEVVIDDLEKAVEGDKADSRIWQVLGDAYMKAGRIDESIKAYRRGMDSV